MKKTIEDMHKLAKERNLVFLSKEYIDSHAKRKWQCLSCSHIFLRDPTAVQQGKSCSICKAKLRPDKGPAEMDKLRDSIKSRPIECLSKTYVSAKHKLLFKCTVCSNKWFATPSGVKSGKGCPPCGYVKRVESRREAMARERREMLAKEQ